MEKTFEQSIKELEQVVVDLEKGELSLEDAIKNFEKGMELSKECSKRLEQAEKKINVLVNNNGVVKEQPFEVTE